jgi:hypothetical protein
LESNWQWNVARYGLVGLGLKRAARLLELPDYLSCQYIRRDAGSLALYYSPDPDQLPVFVGNYNIGPLHFPCGQLVEPD